MCLVSLSKFGVCEILPVFVLYPLYWRVAPSNESNNEPNNPPNVEVISIRVIDNSPDSVHCWVIKYTSPISNPPNILANVPPRDTPPFVPLGTCRSVVISLGLVVTTEPISEANVSPQQQAIEVNTTNEVYVL